LAGPWWFPRQVVVRPTGSGPASVAQLEQEIWEVGMASEMLLVADMLAATPGGEPYAVNRLRFITENYADTQPAREAQVRLAALTERKMP